MEINLPLPLPGVRHGERMALIVLDERARDEPQSPWVSVAVDDDDASKGYKDITYKQFANAVNHAAHWLVENLPPSGEDFQSFAYVGPKDLRYPIFAMAAGKVGKVMILPSPMMTVEAQTQILDKKDCKLYVRADTMASIVDEVVQRNPSINIVSAPRLDALMLDKLAEPIVYPKSWEEGKDDPWLVFHTSGTTAEGILGYPKPITYTHRMMAIVDVAAKLTGNEETHLHHYTFKRWYTPLPMIHFVGMLMVTSMSTFVHTVIVLGPPKPPSSEIVIDVVKYGKVDGALLVPAMIDALCRDNAGLAALRTLSYIHYAGAPLGIESGKKLASHVRLIPCIGSTEVGGYFLALRDDTEDWDYITFNRHAGAEFEGRSDNLHELVFVRKPECAPMQQIFHLYPDLDRFETNDLWREHPTRKGLWKIVGRMDDYVYLAHGEGLHASTMEAEIERHDSVQAALIGGHGRSKPVVLLELVPEAHRKSKDLELLESLRPYLEKANEVCHASVHVSPELVIISTPDRPLVRTMKGSVARLPSLKLYKEDINALFEKGS